MAIQVHKPLFDAQPVSMDSRRLVVLARKPAG